MSNITMYFLVLFLVLAFSTACNSRPLGAVHNEPAKDFQFSAQTNENSSVGRVSIPAKVEPSLLEEVESGNSTREKVAVHGDKENFTKPAAKFHLEGEQRHTASGPAVSWKLPQKKRGKKQPGFNLDYAPPKTHPPTHN